MLQLYKDANHNFLIDDDPLSKKISIVQFPYLHNSGNYPCQYTPGTSMGDNGVTFDVLDDGSIEANGILNSKQYARFNLNDTNPFVDGVTYTIKDCMLCYRLPENERPTGNDGYQYISSGNLQWKSSYIFVAIYIQISNDSNDTKIISNQKFKPTIQSNQRDWNILTINGKTISDISRQLQTQDVNLSIDYSLDLREFDLKKDDVIYVKIIYNVSNMAAGQLVNSNQLPFSNLQIIESSGVMRVNMNNVWHEGQVWINIDGAWKEATDVFVNINDSWKESV